jgi:uncharacterized protein YcsI (UPF0317 family)
MLTKLRKSHERTHRFAEELSQAGEHNTVNRDADQGIRNHEQAAKTGRWCQVPVTCNILLQMNKRWRHTFLSVKSKNNNEN